MLKVGNKSGYNFYTGLLGGERVFNIIKEKQPAPVSGYYSPEYILKIKGFNPSDISIFSGANNNESEN